MLVKWAALEVEFYVYVQMQDDFALTLPVKCFWTVRFLMFFKEVSSNHNIGMISEGSCDTEDWSNDAENSALITGINYIFKYIQIESNYL